MKKKEIAYRPVDILNVFYQTDIKKINVGRLAYKNSQCWFEYDEEFLHSGLELSPIKLPLQRGLVSGKESPFEGLFGVFNDSLPDGWGRLLLDRYMTSLGIEHGILTPIDRLAYIGNNGMGALSYEPDYSKVEENDASLDLNELNAEVNKVIEGESTEALEELYNLGGSSAGARPKVLVGYNAQTNKIIHGQQELPSGFEHWMVKFASSIDQKDIGRIEFAYSLMAKKSGIEMPETKLFQGEGQNQWFGIKRFDRIGNIRVHMHSAAGLLHADHRYPSLDYDGLFRCVLKLNQNILEVTKLFRLAVFNVYAHNRDDHSKNFSFLMDEKGIWKFAPAYDLTFSSGPGGEHCTMINSEGKNPGKKQFMELAERFSIKNANQIIAEVKESVSKWTDIAKEAGVNKNSSDILQKKLNSMLKN